MLVQTSFKAKTYLGSRGLQGLVKHNILGIISLVGVNSAGQFN